VPAHPGLTHVASNHNVHVLTAPAGADEAALAELRKDPRVRIAEKDVPLSTHFQPNDVKLEDQWGIAKIGAPTAWNVVTGTSSVIVAIIDSGIDLTHPEFAGRIVPGVNYVDKAALPNDDYGHGTHVAGIVGAAGNNGSGGAGVAWGAKLLPLKVLNGSGAGFGSDLILALDEARLRGAKVVNISLGTSASSTLLQEAIDRAVKAGIIVVASAGNTGASGNATVYPAASKGVLAVGATDRSDRRANFSTTGPFVGLSAPGVAILSTYRGGGYATMSGTSMAAPFVSGLVALVWSRSPDASARDVRAAIEGSAVDLGKGGDDEEYGAGRIDAAAWARAVTGQPLTDPTPTPTAAKPMPTATPTKPQPTATSSKPAYPGPKTPAPSTTPSQPQNGVGANVSIYVPSVFR
jgi:subtilisin family serine protease